MSQPSYSPHQQQSGLIPTVGTLDMSGNADLTISPPDCAGVMEQAYAHHLTGAGIPAGGQASGVTKMPVSERGPQN